MDQTDADRAAKKLADAEVSDIDLTQEEIYVDGERLTQERADALVEEFDDVKDRLSVHERTGDTIPANKLMTDLELD